MSGGGVVAEVKQVLTYCEEFYLTVSCQKTTKQTEAQGQSSFSTNVLQQQSSSQLYINRTAHLTRP